MTTMPNTLELVRGLSEAQVVEVTKELFNAVYSNVPYDQVASNSKGIAEVSQLVSLSDKDMQQELSAADSARFGRLLLEQYAQDPALAPLVEQAWEKVESSDELIVEVIVALGIVVSLTLLVATTKVEIEKGADGKLTWKINKGRAGPDLVKSVINPLAEVAKVSGQ